MNTTDIKLFLINTATLAVSFSSMEAVLKMILLIMSIVYTAQRSWNLFKKEKED